MTTTPGKDGHQVVDIDEFPPITATVSPAAVTNDAFTNVAAAAADTAILAANASRVGATIYNDSTANCYLKLGTGASTTSFTAKMGSGSYYEVPFGYVGAINGYWDAANGYARVTEFTK